jgi:hypothetical protein
MVALKRASAAVAAVALALSALAAVFLMPRLNELTGKAVSEGILGMRARIESALGLTISFDSLSPSILRSASFSGLAISAPGGRTLLSAKKVRATYDILSVLRGRSSEALTGLELEDVTLDLRIPEDQAVLDHLVALAGGGGAGNALPKILVTGKNVSASVAVTGLGSASFAAREIDFSNVKDEPSFFLEGRFSVLPEAAGIGQVRGPLSLSGSLAKDFSMARLELTLSADSRVFSLSTQRFELVYGDRRLVLTKVKDRSPLDAEFDLDFGGGESSASLLLDGYVPAKGLRLEGPLAHLEPWLEMPYTGKIQASAPALDFSRIAYAVRLSGALPRGILPGEEGEAYADISARGDMKSVSVEKARLEKGRERIEYSGSFGFADLSPDGVLDLDFSLMGGELAVSSSVRLVGHGGEYAALADEATIGGVVFKDLALTAARKGPLADFNFSFRPPAPAGESSDASVQGFSGEAGASAGSSMVKIEGSVSFEEKPNLELSADLETIDLGPLEPLLDKLGVSPETASWLASLRLGGALFATSDFTRISWSATDLTLVSSYLPGAYAILSLSGNSTSLAVKRALVSAFGLAIEGSGKLDFSETGRLGFEADLAYQGIPYALKGSLIGNELAISGDYGLELTARVNVDASFVALRASSLPIPLFGGIFLATVDAQGRYATPASWDAVVAELTIVPAGESMATVPKVELAGSFSPDAAQLSRVRIEDRYSAVVGKASLTYSLAEPLSASVTAVLSADPAAKASPEYYSLTASYSGGKVDAALDLAGSPLARLGKLPIVGSLDGRISASGELADPSLDFSLKLRDGRYLDQTLIASASGSYSSGGIELHDASAAYQGQSISAGSATFSFADASSTLALSFAGNLLGSDLSFRLAARGTSMKGGVPSLAERLQRYSASGTLSGFSWGTISTASWPFLAVADSGSISLVSGPQEEIQAKYAPGGTFTASLRSPFPALAEVSGLFDGKNIDLSVQGLSFDLRLLSPLMPPDLIKILDGRARGGFRAVGLVGDPEITGKIDIENASLKVLGWLADDVGPFDASIVATGKSVSSSIGAVKIGKATASMQVQATFDQWLPVGLTASVATVPGSHVSMDASLLGISAKAQATAGLKFALQGDVLDIDCDVALEGGNVVVSSAVLNQPGPDLGERPSIFLAVSANVSVGKGVHVFFPSTALPVIDAYSDPTSLLAVRYDQESGDFTLKGTVALRGGEVFYIQRNFFLKNGKIVFNEDSDRFEPRVTLLAELRDRNDQGQPIAISMRADNEPLTSFHPQLSSDPPMSESQIALLMGQNLFDAAPDNSLDLRKTLISGSQFIPQLDVTRVYLDKARDGLGLDMLSMKTQVLQNWLIDIAVPASQTGDALGQYFDQSEIYAGKYLNDSIFAHASLLLNDNPLAGYTKPELDSELGVELDSPFGLIQWNVDPKNWDNLLISDQSLSISWKLSY